MTRKDRVWRTGARPLGLLLVGLATSGCIIGKAPQRTGTLTSDNVATNDREAWIKINDFVTSFLDSIEISADRIAAATEDPRVRRNTLLWKLNGTSDMMVATSSPDAGLALIDAWALCLQMRDALTTGPSRDAFGEHQPLAVAVAEQSVSEIDALIRSMTVSGDAPLGRKLAHDWAAEHPMDNPYFIRRTAVGEMLAIAPEASLGALASVSALSQSAEALSIRLATYANLLPRQARWEAELLLDDPRYRELLEETRHALRIATEQLEAIGALVEGSPPLEELVDTTVETVDQSVGRALAELEAVVGRQRQALEALVDEEAPRLAEYTELQRDLILGQLNAELATTLERVDVLTARTVADTQVTAEQIVEQAYGKAVRLLLLFFGGVLVVLVAYRLLFARR